MIEPLLKWPGGKRRLVERIAARFPDGRCRGRLIEPFTGSASVFLGLGDRVARALLTDANLGLINFHQVTRERPIELAATLELAYFPRGEAWREFYGVIRDDYNDLARVGTYAAARLLWLNRTSFNGLYRENRRGHMNAPPGDYATPNLPPPERILQVSEALERAEIREGDFRATIAEAEAGDWLYLDPPYDPLTGSADFTGYAAGGFSARDQEDLAVAALEARRRGVRVVASNHATEAMIRLWGECGFGLDTFPIKRSIGRTVESRGAIVHELLAWG